MRPLMLAALTAVSLSLTGCCSMARLFCGPDTSPWVSVDFRTPELAVRTFLEALRRDDPEVVYLCLSSRMRKDLQVDSGTTQMAWPKIRDQYPGLHMAGYAEVPPIQRAEHGTQQRAEVTIDVEGTQITLRLVRECFWEVRWTRSDEPYDSPARNAVIGKRIPNDDASEFVLAKALAGEDFPIQSVVTVGSMTVTHNDRAEIAIADIESAGIERKWKIDSFQ